MKVKGKVIVVTDAGSGIGRELCLYLISKGASVGGVDLNEKALDETAVLAAGSNHQFRGYAANVTDRATIEALSAQILSGVGEVDGVINNAGVIQPFLRLNDLDYATRGRCEDRTGTLKAREHQDHAGRVHAGSELA